MKSVSSIKNSIFSVIDTLVMPLTMIIATPIFLIKLGVQDYGIWMFINSLVILMSIVNIGGVDTLIRYIPKYRKYQDLGSINVLFSTVFTSQLIFAVLLMLLSFTIISLLDFDSFDGEFRAESEFKAIFHFGTALFSLKLIEQIIFSYFKGYERLDIASFLSVCSKLTLIITQLITAIITKDLYWVILFSVINACVILLIEIVFIKRVTPGISLFTLFSYTKLKEVFSYAKWSWLISIVGVVASQVDKWLVVMLTNMSTLAYYSLALLVFSNIHGVIASSISWIFPKVGLLKSKKEVLWYYLFLQILLVLASLIISVILIESDIIFELWLTDNYKNTSVYLYSFFLLIPIYSLTIVPFFMLKGLGLIKYNFYSDLGMLMIRVSFAYVLYIYFDVVGIIIAIGISGYALGLFMVSILKIKYLTLLNMHVAKIYMVPILYIIIQLYINEYRFVLIPLLILYCVFLLSTVYRLKKLK
ncbi:MAG: oligosaccharide flippase family protein [Pseudomonadales bacterium]|nr:oligosaccharide flippase family protein [Pseudomonadales bacterium]